MKYLDQLDDQFARTALNDEQRAARIAELAKYRRHTVWGVVLLAAMTLIAFALRRGGELGLAFATVLFWFQFYKLDADLRTLKIVDALKRREHDTNAA